MSDFENFIGVKPSDVISIVEPLIRGWDSGGGEERSRVALIASYKKRLLDKAPSTKGFLWWKRPMTPQEKLEWLDKTWDSNEDFSDGSLYAFWAKLAQAKREDRIDRLREALSIAGKTTDAIMYISNSDWEFAHRRF